MHFDGGVDAQRSRMMSASHAHTTRRMSVRCDDDATTPRRYEALMRQSVRCVTCCVR